MTKKQNDQISQLLAMVELNINCCEIIINEIKHYREDPFKFTSFVNDEIGQYMITICNNHFFEGISILTTLLWPQRGEICFVKTESESYKKLESIKYEFKKKNFLELRHNIVDHKNEKN